MTYELRVEKAHEILNLAKELARETFNGSYNGKTTELLLEEPIPNHADRKAITERLNEFTLVESVTFCKRDRIEITFINRSVEDLIKELRDFRFYRTEYLDENYVFDEDESVKWNREQVELHNQGEKERKLRSEEEYEKLEEMVKREIFEEAPYCFEKFGIKDEQLDIIYGKAYADGHSGGYYEVYHRFLEECEMISNILESISK